MIAAGLIVMSENKKASDFLVAGRKLTLPFTVATLTAVQIGAGIILGGSATGAWVSNVPSLLGIFIAQLLACGSILSGFGIPFYKGVMICAGVILIYCTLGGLWGIVLTDVIQTTIILISIPVISIVSLLSLKGYNISPSAVFSTPFIPAGTFTKFVYLVMPFLIAISVSYDAYIRYQAARDAKTAKWGCIIAGIIVIFIGILTSSVGAVAKFISRLAVVFSVVAGILLSYKITDILDAIIIFNYPYMGSLLIPLLAGVLWKGATKKGAIAAIFTGGIIGAGAFLAGIPGILKGWINADLGLFYAYIASLAVLIIVSRLKTINVKRNAFTNLFIIIRYRASGGRNLTWVFPRQCVTIAVRLRMMNCSKSDWNSFQNMRIK
jgi:SSS family solute:Na+ symporter